MKERRSTKTTTVRLPEHSLRLARKIARARDVSLGSLLSEAVADGLKCQAARVRSAEIVGAYQRAFAGFSNDELAMLDGVLLEPVDSGSNRPS